jgi:AcrR family transcriptional regulator
MRGFSEEERERIREELREAGGQLFGTHGLQKTTIEDITGDVDIGTSTFYRFYDSKEELYLAVLEEAGEDVRRRMSEAGVAETDDPQEAVEQLLKVIIEEIERNPLARRITVDPETRQRLQDHRSDAERKADHEADLQFIRSIVDPFLEEDRLHGQDPEVVAEAIAAIPYLCLHRDEIGDDNYQRVLEFVVESFTRGLATTE